MKKVYSGCYPFNRGQAYTDQSSKKRIAELEDALDLILSHKDSVELVDAFQYGLKVLGNRETYHHQ